MVVALAASADEGLRGFPSGEVLVGLCALEHGGLAGLFPVVVVGVRILLRQLVQRHGQSVPCLSALGALGLAQVGDDGHGRRAGVLGGLHVVVELAVGADDAIQLHLVLVDQVLVVLVLFFLFQLLVVDGYPHLVVALQSLARVGDHQFAAGDIAGQPLRLACIRVGLRGMLGPVLGEVEHGPLVVVVVLVLPIDGGAHHAVVLEQGVIGQLLGRSVP